MIAILDVLTVILILGAIVLAASKGFIQAIINLLGTVVAFGAALFFSDFAVELINNKYVTPFFEKTASEAVGNFMTTQAVDPAEFSRQFEELFTNAPQALQDMLNRFSADATDVYNAFLASPDSIAARDAAISAIIEPIASAVSLALGFLAVFIGTYIVIKIAAFVIDSVFRLPVLKQINGFFGVLLGALQGILCVFILTAVVAYLAPTIENYSGETINQETIDESLVFKYFYNASPMKDLLM